MTGPIASAPGFPALAAARVPREELQEALDELGDVLAFPSRAREAQWQMRVARKLATVRDAWHRHVAVAEGSGGLFDEVMAEAPRLAHAIDRLRGEHGAIDAEISNALVGVELVDGPESVERVRSTLLDLLRHCATHRHRGAELVYDAYNTDISGMD